MRRPVICLLFCWSLLACGADDPVCPLDKPGTQFPYCGSAINLALRESDHLVLQQPEVDFFYELQKPAWNALPILRLTMVNNDSMNTPTAFMILSTYPPLVSAWIAGEVRTGDDLVDRWFADAGAFEVTRLAIDVDGVPSFYVRFGLPVSWRVLERGIEEIPETGFEPDHVRAPMPPYVELAWDGDDAVVTYVVGWGDCFVECSGTHTWQARTTPDREVDIVDLGGDPVPAYVEEGAMERPAPL